MPYGSGSVGDAWSWPSEGILALRRGPAELAPRHWGNVCVVGGDSEPAFGDVVGRSPRRHSGARWRGGDASAYRAIGARSGQLPGI